MNVYVLPPKELVLPCSNRVGNAIKTNKVAQIWATFSFTKLLQSQSGFPCCETLWRVSNCKVMQIDARLILFTELTSNCYLFFNLSPEGNVNFVFSLTFNVLLTSIILVKSISPFSFVGKPISKSPTFPLKVFKNLLSPFFTI